MLGLDQAECLYRLLFISLIGRSSPKVPLWAVIKEPFVNRGQIPPESKGNVCFFAFLVPEFFVTKPTGASEALKRPLELLLAHFPCDGGCHRVDTCKEGAALCLEEPNAVPHSEVHQAGRRNRLEMRHQVEWPSGSGYFCKGSRDGG